MKIKVRIEGYIDAPDDITEKEVKESIYFSLGLGSLSLDNQMFEPDWHDADVEVFI